MVKFKAGFIKDGKGLIKIEFDSGHSTWATSPIETVNMARQQFKDGDAIDGNCVRTETIEGKKKYFIDTIVKVSGGTEPTPAPYTSNTDNSSYKSKPSARDESIVKQCAMKCACMAIQTLSGQVSDVDTLKAMVLQLGSDIYEDLTK